MFLTLTAVCVVALCLLIANRIKRARDQSELEQHSITPEALYTLLASNQEVLLFDVRQPLDLLADAEIIVGAKRIPPKDLLENPTLIPKEKDSVVYCTCPSDKTSRVERRDARVPQDVCLQDCLTEWIAKIHRRSLAIASIRVLTSLASL